jgi:hypothetical protein
LKRDVRLEQQRRKRLEGFPTLFTDEELDNFERASTRLSIDSGAHGLFNKHVPKGTRDYSYYDLSKGTKFRQYCDSYAAFMKELRGSGIWCVNVDAIYHPELTWQIQKFFENEHGITPVPVVHCDTPMRDVDRYLEAGQYPLLGVGGLGQGITIQKFRPWADKLFAHIPKEIKTHGFAMTSPELLFRYRWTSVDSATWVKKSAYGWLHIPVFSEKDGWLFDDPMEVNVSDTPPKGAEKKHYKNIPKEVQRMVDQWLHHIGLNIQLVASHHRKRSIANLIYLSELGESAGVKMFFSGGGGLNDTPEALIPERNPHVMLTFHNIHQENSDTVERLSKYVERKEEWRRSGEHPLPC